VEICRIGTSSPPAGRDYQEKFAEILAGFIDSQVVALVYFPRKDNAQVDKP
jgi:hypothetical protein